MNNQNETANYDALTDSDSYEWSATYCLDDNKLRLYYEGFGRFTDEDREAIKSAGYRWARKQECYVCPRWTCKAEDMALDMAGHISDESYGPEERAADRAERFEGYRGKRLSEAVGHADDYSEGGQVFGNQNTGRAERQARKAGRQRDRALSQWSKSEYWQQRTEGVIAHALYKARPDVRRGRILRLEKEQRKHEKEREEARKRWQTWTDIKSGKLSGEVADALAYQLANHSWGDWKHPTTGEEVRLYQMLPSRFGGEHENALSPEEVAAVWLERYPNEPGQEGSNSWRWSQHYKNRLAFENAMLENEGGKASDVEIIPGGWFGKHQVQGVNKSPATKRVTSVKLWSTDHRGNRCLRSFNIERLGRDAYRPPTPEELEAFKAEKKANKPKTIKLLNPSKEDAARLQMILNEGSERPGEVIEMTQKEYSYKSKSDHVFPIHMVEGGDYVYYRPEVNKAKNEGTALFRVRSTKRIYGTPSVIVLTDKKANPIDFDSLKLPEEEPAPAPAPAEEEATKELEQLSEARATAMGNGMLF